MRGAIIMKDAKLPDKTVMIYIINNPSTQRVLSPTYIVWDGEEILYVSTFSMNILAYCERMNWLVIDTVSLTSVLPHILPDVNEEERGNE